MDICKKAIIIETENRYKTFRQACNNSPKPIRTIPYKEKKFPIYVMIVKTVDAYYAIPNPELDDSPLSVYNNGYITISYDMFLNIIEQWNNELNTTTEV